MSKPDDHDLRPRRRFSLWSLLAPIALVVVIVAMYAAIHASKVVKDGGTKTTAAAKKSASHGSKSCPVRRGHLVLPKETFQSIAAEFCLSQDQLRACNPELVDTYNIRVGERINVGKKFCTRAAANDAGSVNGA